jgi:hypothetical protein
METKPTSTYLFRHAARQNLSVARNLEKLKARAIEIRRGETPSIDKRDVRSSSPIQIDSSRPTIMFSTRSMADLSLELRDLKASKVTSKWPILGMLLFATGILSIGYVFWPTIYNLFINFWKIIIVALGGILIGAGIILFFVKIGDNPLKKLHPPNGFSDEPLYELKLLADRTVTRLKTAYRVQLSLIFILSTILTFVILWSVYMVTIKRMVYATAFGSSSIGMLALSKWKWQPFERMAEARKQADDADILATGLRLRIESISQIVDPEKRSQKQWDAISEYLDRS